MVLPDPGAGIFDMASIVEPIVAGARTARIEIYDSALGVVDAPYDFDTDTGGVKSLPVIWPIGKPEGEPARIQELVEVALRPLTNDEWDVKRNFQIDIALDPAMPFLRKGLRIRVLDGGNDPELVKLGYQISNSTTNSLTNQRTIQAVSDGADTTATVDADNSDG
jgi:hypothetical protein